MKNFFKTFIIISLVFNYYSFGQNQIDDWGSNYNWVFSFYEDTTNWSDEKIESEILKLERRGISLENQAQQVNDYYLNDDKTYNHFVRLEVVDHFYSEAFPEMGYDERQELGVTLIIK